MLSRVFRGADTITEEMPWQQAGEPAGSIRPTVQLHSAPGRPAAAEDPAQLQARLASLETQAERRVSEARDAGFREGEAAGRGAAQALVQPVLEKFAASVQQLAEFRPGLRSQAEEDLVRLAIAIARRIVNRELTLDAAAIGGLVKVGLEKVRAQEVSCLRIHPDYQTPVREFLAHAACTQVKVLADPTLERGAVVFETTRGNLDLSAETQLLEIERGLTDRLRGHGK